MKRLKKIAGRLLTLGVVVAFLYAGGWYLCESVYPSFSYGIEAEFAELPPDDNALQAWLERQPGVATAVVRRNESRKLIDIILIMSRNLHGKPAFPNVDKACAELGYKGQVAPFRDTDRPDR